MARKSKQFASHKTGYDGNETKQDRNLEEIKVILLQ
jgi:hypothetical protein